MAWSAAHQLSTRWTAALCEAAGADLVCALSKALVYALFYSLLFVSIYLMSMCIATKMAVFFRFYVFLGLITLMLSLLISDLRLTK